ncbi:MAG: hypothetical protein ACLGPL_00640 [Acidobacteriota bacterium]
MKKTASISVILFAMVVVLSGPAGGAQSRSGGSAHTPPSKACQLSPTASNDLFDSHLALIRDAEDWPVGFQLSLENKTDQELTIVWNNTRYLRHGKENGGFQFVALPVEGVQSKEPPTTIAPREKLSIQLWPEATLFKSGPKLGYTRNAFTRGDQGMAVTVKTKDGRQITEKVAIDISDPRCAK